MEKILDGKKKLDLSSLPIIAEVYIINIYFFFNFICIEWRVKKRKLKALRGKW